MAHAYHMAGQDKQLLKYLCETKRSTINTEGPGSKFNHCGSWIAALVAEQSSRSSLPIGDQIVSSYSLDWNELPAWNGSKFKGSDMFTVSRSTLGCIVFK